MRHQNDLAAKGNTQGRHYMPKSPSRAAQPLDLTHTTSGKIAKIALELLKACGMMDLPFRTARLAGLARIRWRFLFV